MAQSKTNEEIKQQRIGEVNYNFHNQKMEIIDYINHENVTVRFDDGTIRTNVYYYCFKNGTVKNFEAPDVYGVGISGSKKKKINGKMSKEYSTWTNMLQRCYDPEKWVEFPRYKDCTVSEEWLYFDNFYEWCHQQDNWNKVINAPNGFHLDKDIINKGNQIYSPQTCSFVPSVVNALFVKGNSMRGDLPIGVSTTKSGKYRARCSFTVIGEKTTHHTADTPEQAFYYYKTDKEYLIKEVARREYKKGNIVQKCYEAMLKYEVEITD